MVGVVTQIPISEGSIVVKGQELLVLEAMKMENAIIAPVTGQVGKIAIQEGQTVNKGDLLIVLVDDISHKKGKVSKVEKTKIIDRLSELYDRKAYIYDKARPAAIEKRHKKGQNTARENIALLTDEGTFIEYGSLIIAAQRSRRTDEDLIKNTPADGLITGRCEINSRDYPDQSSCLVMAYDFTVLAGTQGSMNHTKMDRVIAIAKDRKLPVILFAEGGGGRPGDVDLQTIAGLFISTFVEYAGLQDVVPTISIVSGYCFAGNAALAGSSDVIIGTQNSSIGMGGPAMIEGGGLGKFHPREVGPSTVHVENGVIDVLVEDENEAILVAKKYLSYWQGVKKDWGKNDQHKLQDFIPNNRKRNFDIRGLINILVDSESILELRSQYGKGLITCFARIEGIPIGILANNSAYQAGAITAVNATKAAAFISRCNNYNIPIVSLIDTPGIMVGPEAEKDGTVKHAGSLFIAGAKFRPPFVSVVLRRAYGLGAMAMMGGSTRRSEFTVSWPTGEFGAMGLEGAVKLGYRKELEAISDPAKRDKLYQSMVAEAYERGKALSMATMYEIDDVIEPKDTRKWILMTIKTSS